MKKLLGAVFAGLILVSGMAIAEITFDPSVEKIKLIVGGSSTEYVRGAKSNIVIPDNDTLLENASGDVAVSFYDAKSNAWLAPVVLYQAEPQDLQSSLTVGKERKKLCCKNYPGGRKACWHVRQSVPCR
jgi:hypothetical protein